MSEMKIYKVTLEPLDWFFFGGESTFDNSVKQSYIAHSNLFPQQTALLGMLRYQLLKQNNLLYSPGSTPNKENVNVLIGSESFMIDKKEQIFGKIKGLSPIYVEKEFYEIKKKGGNQEKVKVVLSYFPAPLTDRYNLSFDEKVRVCLNGKEKNSLINDNESFDAKQYNNYLIYHDKNGHRLWCFDIFTTKMQIGITKNTDKAGGDEIEKGRFFKHEMVRFNNDKENKITFRFAFYTALEEALKDDFVYLGAERSCFKMCVQEQANAESLQQELLQVHPSAKKEGRIELLSPTFVEDMSQLNELCKFHWSFLTPFRNITQVKDGQGKLHSGDVVYNRGGVCYNMLCAGSVLFFDDTNRQKIEELLNNVHLQNIGYNYYDSMKQENK